MTITTEAIALGQEAPPIHAERLRMTTAAVRVSFTWFGVGKTLSPEQKSQAAETFGAEARSLSATKKLLDTACPAFRAVTAMRNRIVGYWRSVSLPYPEPGIRLIRQDQIEFFDQQMTDMREELDEAVFELDRQFPGLKDAARHRLGSLYNVADYPDSLRGMFAFEWDFPSVEPPQYLLQLNPELYEQERRRMVARFEEAVAMAEQAFIAEFGRLVGHLAERLSGSEDGHKKVFRDSAVTNLSEFFDRFRLLNVRSNEQLDAMVQTTHRLLRGIAPQDLRDSDSLREQIFTLPVVALDLKNPPTGITLFPTPIAIWSRSDVRIAWLWYRALRRRSQRTGDGTDPVTQDFCDAVTSEDDGFVVSDLAVFNNQGNVAVRVSSDGSRYTVIGGSFAKTFSAEDTDNLHGP